MHKVAHRKLKVKCTYRHLCHIYTGPLNFKTDSVDFWNNELTTETFDDILKDFACVNRSYQWASPVTKLIQLE